MKKFNKVLMLLAVVLLVASPVFAVSATEPSSGTAIGNVTGLAGNVWSTIKIVAQVAAIAAIAYAVYSYMTPDYYDDFEDDFDDDFDDDFYDDDEDLNPTK